MGSDSVGARFGRYRILSEIGSGGMGVVYRAAHLDTGMQVAIKTVRLPKPWLLSTLRREITALTRIAHPGVIRIIDQGLDDGIPWYAMELHSGRTLEEFRDRWVPAHQNGAVFDSSQETTDVGRAAPPMPVERRPTLEPVARRPPNPWLAEGLSVVRRLCSTLAYVHGRGIVHRDLKPANVLLRRDGAPILTDFGLVFHLGSADGRRTLDLGASRQGTPAYMAPELARGAWGDARVDLYALGCILYELVTGTTPFEGATATDVIEKHLSATPIAPSALIEEVPIALERLIIDLLEKDPMRRLSYADDVGRVLDDLGVEGGDLPEPEWQPRPYLYRAELAGRSEARERLAAAVMRAVGGHGGVVLLGGTSGEGKTTLATAACAVAADEGLDVITSICAPTARGDVEASHGAPLHAFTPLMRAVIDLCVSGGAEAAARLLGPRGGALAVYEPALSALLQKYGLPAPADVPIDALQELVLTTFAEVIHRFADERPLLLVIDDLQWADELSLKLVASLASSMPERRSLLIVGTYRTDEVSKELQTLLSEPSVEKIGLTPLDQEAIAAMVGQMLGTPTPPEPLSRFLARCSGGNPLFVCEYLGAALEERRLERTAGRWEFRLDEAGSSDAEGFEQMLGMAPSVHALIARRLDAVSATAREMVETASVFGKRCEIDLILAVATGNEEERLGALDELLRHRILEQTGGTVLFVHDRIRDVAYDRIPLDRRPALHRTAALALEARLQANPETPSLLGELANHWKIAGDAVKQAEYLEKSADHSLRTSAYRDAQTRYAELLAVHATGAVVADALRLARWHIRLAEAAKNLDDFGTGRTHLKAALSVLGWPVPESRPGLVAGTVIEVGRQFVRRVRDGWTLEQHPESAAITTAANASHLLLETSRSMGDAILPLYATMRSLNLSEDGAPPAMRGRAYALLQVMLSSAGLGGIARRYAPLRDRALELTSDPQGRLDILLLRAVFFAYTANPTEGVPSAEAARQLARELGFRRRWDEATYCMAAGETARGNYRAGLSACQELLDSSRRGANRVRAWGLIWRALILARQRHMDDARAAVDELVDLLPGLELSDAPLPHAVTGLVHLLQGEHATARRWADSGAQLLARTPDFILEQQASLPYLIETYVTLWRLAIASGSAEAGDLERAACRLSRKTLLLARRFPSLGPDGAYWAGEIEWTKGRPAAARRRWLDALQRAQTLAMPVQEAAAHLGLSRTLQGAEAEDHRHRAVRILEQIGIPTPTTEIPVGRRSIA